MSDSELARLLSNTADRVVAFDREGRERKWSELLALAGGVAAALAPRRARRWALDLANTFDFTAALLGAWAAEKTAILAPAALLPSGDGGVAYDGLVSFDPLARELAADTLDLCEVEPDSAALGTIPAAAGLTLFTSGSTGRPKEVHRQLGNVEAELATLEALWGWRLGGARVYSTVSHTHVYGLLFRVLWPLYSQRPFATFDCGFPEQLVDARSDGAALIASPAILKRLSHLSERVQWRAVFSSGGLLPDTAAEDALRVLGVRPVEVLGSTETSGIAWREQDDAKTPWAPMPGVGVRVDEESYLVVRSPFSGADGWLRSGDLAELAPDGAFRLLGRGDHIAKIEDKRISLAAIERLAAGLPEVQDAAAIALESAGRQHVGLVLQLTATGKRSLERLGRRAFGNAIKDSLRAGIDRIAVPRKIRYVEVIPVNAQGKRQVEAIRQLFE